jgi:hypothetical protein
MSEKQLKSDSRTSKFFKNSATTLLYQGVLLIVGFITPRIMLSYYGSDINGLVSSLAQFVSYFTLVEAGISSATVYSLYKPLAENDHHGISAIVSAANKFYYQSGFIFLALICLLSVLYPLLITHPANMNYLSIAFLTLVAGVSGVLDFFTLAKYRALLTADQKTYVVSLATMTYTISNVFIIAVLAVLHQNICVVKFVALFSVFLRSAILIMYCRKNYTYIDYHAKPNKKALSKRWDALFQQVLSVVQQGAPIIILSLTSVNLRIVSVYTIYNMVMAGLNSLLSIFISGLSASFGEVIAKGERKILQKAYSEFETAYYIVINIIYSVALVMIMPFVKIYTNGISDVNYYMPLAGLLFVTNGFLYNLKTPQGMLVLSAGMYKETRYRCLIQALIAVVAGTVLALCFGIYGVMAGMIVSNLYRCIDLLIFTPKRITYLPVSKTVIKWIIMLVNISIVFEVSHFVPLQANGYLMWAIYALAYFAFSSILNIAAFVVFQREDMKGVMGRIKKMLRIKT